MGRMTAAQLVLVCCLVMSANAMERKGTERVQYGARAAEYPGYELLGSMQQETWGYSGTLGLLGQGGPYPPDAANLTVEVFFQTEDVLRIRMYDPNDLERWTVPEIILQQSSPSEVVPTSTAYDFTWTDSPFGFAVTRVSSGDVIFNTTSPQASASSVGGERDNLTGRPRHHNDRETEEEKEAAAEVEFNGLIYEEQYIEFSSSLPSSPAIYGLGERVDSLLLDSNDKVYTMFNRDQGTPAHENLYGTHPMYMELRQSEGSTNAHGVFLFNSNAQSVQLQSGALTWRTIGGVVDLWFMLGPSPVQVIEQYSSVVGRPAMPPYWHLGFNQCRWGYKSIQETASVTYNYKRFNIPLDTQWNDIDIFDEYRDFTTDPTYYPVEEVRAFTDYLHGNGQHYIMITDPGIEVYPDQDYAPYDDGVAMDVFVKSGSGEGYELGSVWPGYCYFPDFSRPNTSEYWTKQLQTFRDSTGPVFDGVWIDMNEISNFCTGECDATPPPNKLDSPPFNPLDAPLNTSTISMTAKTWLGVEYNTHSLYSFYEAYVTHNSLSSLTGKRPVVLTRSSFAGSGKYTSHWLGDNTSTWDDLYYSIPGVLAMQMFGIPMVGADICGFNGNTTEELCSRWMQLGSFYPFSRNHNSIGSTPQEPWAFHSKQHIDVTRKSLEIRYLLLPFFYTLFANSHTYGTPVWQALSWQFADDASTWGLDRQFLVGDALLVSPVLEQGATEVDAYFPAALWYDFYTGAALDTSAGGAWETLSAPITHIPVHVRAGHVLPAQMPALTTTASRTLPFVLFIAPDSTGAASGSAFLDDGESLDVVITSAFTSVEFTLTNWNYLASVIHVSGYENAGSVFVGELKVLGYTAAPPTTILVNGNAAYANFWMEEDILVISGLSLPMDSAFSVTWY
mmetsp:Transcript_1630/g.5773  ORF Transcript_1630/g.5773 Transcript_1630/m.5773 type:complete len:900 (+) Transcript_1630:70-2769(+)